MNVAVVDAGLGNLRSVVRALEATAPSPDAHVHITADPDAIARADVIVMPGQGAFGDCSRALEANGRALAHAVLSTVRAGKPFLGICLGLQVLLGSSDEAPGCAGLGLFAGHVKRFSSGLFDVNGAPLKVPHIGWNEVQWTTRRTPEWFYFVHSYYVVPDDESLIAARTTHGETFVSAIEKDNVLAVQFHPEKSQRAGLELLAAWWKGLQ